MAHVRQAAHVYKRDALVKNENLRELRWLVEGGRYWCVAQLLWVSHTTNRCPARVAQPALLKYWVVVFLYVVFLLLFCLNV